jgi:hypothetical protein
MKPSPFGIPHLFLLAVSSMAVWACLVQSYPAEAKQAKLIRKYRTDNPELIELSHDGKFLLTQGTRKVKCANKAECQISVPVLAVYEASTGIRVGDFLPEPPDRLITFSAVFFVQEQVRLIESRYETSTRRTAFQWDPRTKSRTILSVPEIAAKSMATCHLGGERSLNVTVTDGRRRLALQDETGVHPVPDLEVPVSGDMRPFFSSGNCDTYKARNRYLIANGHTKGSTLYWVSASPQTAPEVCRLFPDERLDGHAISKDGSVIVVISSRIVPASIPDGRVGEFHAFLNVLDRTCNLTRKVELQLPEGAQKLKTPVFSFTRLDNYHFAEQFGQQLAISPDNRKLALAYGQYRDPNGIAFFGLYSLPDGHRLTTLQGETYKAGILHGGLLSDQLWANSAPITGPLEFSPDSRTLYISSKYVFVWEFCGVLGW